MPLCCMNQHMNSLYNTWCVECESLVAGARISNDYTILSYIKQGSVGAVYLAHQHSLNNRKVVLKVLRSVESREYLEDFQREAAFLASLTHPYILSIYAYGVVDARRPGPAPYAPYLVLPYAEQGSLAQLFTAEGSRPWSVQRLLPLIEDATEALDYAHSRNILHRDVKPANLLMMGSHAMLADFGVSALINTDQSHVDASLAGSPAFMAPEVWLYRPGRYSDQYALAVTCFYLLTGQYPWQPSTGSPFSWSYQHRFVEPRPLHALRPDIPIAVDAVLQRALAKDPHDRYPTLQLFISELKTAAYVARPVPSLQTVKQPEVARIQSPPPPPRRVPMTPYAAPPPARPVAQPVMNPPQPRPVVQPVVNSPQPRPYFPPPQAGTSEMPLPEWLPEEDGNHGTANGDTDSFTLNKKNRNGWVWGALLFNSLICTMLIVLAMRFSQNVNPANLLLALWPVILIGAIVASLFRDVRCPSLASVLVRGTLFGVINGWCSVLFSYGWAALLYTLGMPQKDGPTDVSTLFIRHLNQIMLSLQNFPHILTIVLCAGLMTLSGGIAIAWLATQADRSHNLQR